MIKEKPKENIIGNKSKKFAFRIVALYKTLRIRNNETVMSKQILRSGTSVGANIVEAQSGSSRRDFLNKMYIAFKECNETAYWLDLLYSGEFISEKEYNSMSKDCMELKRLLSSITATTRRGFRDDN